MEIENKEYIKLEECVLDVYKAASKKAINGVKSGKGGPFGAGIIQKTSDGKYKVIVIESNSVIKSKDPTAHAEVNAIRKACEKLNTNFLEECILVTTAKSCPMCLSAACWAKIPEVYYSEAYDDATTSGFKDDDIFEYINGRNPSLIKEIRVTDDSCKIPFEVWNKKEDRIQY